MAIARRTFLKLAAAGGACCGAAKFAAVLAGDDAAPHWGYEGASGPEHWGELAPEFRVCRHGLQQTPIDLAGAARGDASSLGIDYRPFPLRLRNNGHTIEAAVGHGCAITVDGTRYDLLQFHFHHPSEHVIGGTPFDMETHLVHRSAEGGLAVVGVLIKAGARNATLDPILARLPAGKGEEVALAEVFHPAALLPERRASFRYMGSLTTPPCSEGLQWTIFREPIEMSADQIGKFAALFPNNARPLQRRNERALIETGGL